MTFADAFHLPIEVIVTGSVVEFLNADATETLGDVYSLLSNRYPLYQHGRTLNVTWLSQTADLMLIVRA